jgi:hypothetical protein
MRTKSVAGIPSNWMRLGSEVEREEKGEVCITKPALLEL